MYGHGRFRAGQNVSRAGGDRERERGREREGARANLIGLRRSPDDSSSTQYREATKDEDPATHSSEGFLKTMWHNLTNHPAHRPGQPPSSDDPEKPTDKKADEEPKKGAGSG